MSWLKFISLSFVLKTYSTRKTFVTTKDILWMDHIFIIRFSYLYNCAKFDLKVLLNFLSKSDPELYTLRKFLETFEYCTNFWCHFSWTNLSTSWTHSSIFRIDSKVLSTTLVFPIYVALTLTILISPFEQCMKDEFSFIRFYFLKAVSCVRIHLARVTRGGKLKTIMIVGGFDLQIYETISRWKSE